MTGTLLAGTLLAACSAETTVTTMSRLDSTASIRHLAGAPAGMGRAERMAIAHLVERLGASNGNPEVASIEAVRTNRTAANRTAFQDVELGRAGVYLVQACGGTFVGNLAPTPPGTPAPTGRCLTVVIGSRTNGLLDWGLLPKPLAPRTLGELGRVEKIQPIKRQRSWVRGRQRRPWRVHVGDAMAPEGVWRTSNPSHTVTMMRSCYTSIT